MTPGMDIIADPMRREILRHIWRRELTVNELVERFNVSQPAISFHLRVLRENELVSVRQEGTRRYYRAEPEKFGMLQSYLESHWKSALTRLKDQAEIEARQERRRDR